MLENDFHHALAKAVNYCTRAEKCAYDVKNKLYEWGIVDEKTIRDIIEYLIANGYIDHSRYAQAFVHDAILLKKYGKIKIRYLLQQKRIETEFIEPALETIDSENYETLMREEIRKRLKKNTLDENTKQKLIRAMSGRGFETELVIKLLREMIKNGEQ